MAAPNVLLIMCDQLRKDALGCYGNPAIRTPHLDDLAGRGVRFEHIFACLPVCAPNRASIATGRYPSVHGLRQNGIVLPPTELTLMETLRRAGYATWGVGKMHFGPQWRRPDGDQNLIDPDPSLAVNPQPDAWDMPFYGFEKVWLAEDNRVGPYADYLRAHGLDPWADPHSFSYPQHQTVASLYPEEHHQTTWVADRSLDLLRQHDGTRPFFLWTSFVHPHHPFTPPPPYDRMYRPEDMPLPIWDPQEVAGWPEECHAKYTATSGSHEAVGMNTLGPADWQRIKAYYYGMVSLVDKQVGRLLDLLRRRGWLDNTIIIFTSDHGEMLGDHHLLFKDTHYDCVTNVPLIIAPPAWAAAGAVRTQIGHSHDIMPTILEMTGRSVPPAVQGHSLVPLMEDAPAQLYEEAFIEDVLEQYGARTIWTPSARLTWHGPGRRGELYDHRRDPHCCRNLWDDPAAAALQRRLLDRLINRMVGNVDPLPPCCAVC